MQTLNKALLVAATAAAFMLLAVVIATAGERDHQTLEEVNREINDYWQQQRAESDRRLDIQLQQQQLEALQGIEQNTEGE